MSKVEVVERTWQSAKFTVNIVKLPAEVVNDKLAILSDGTGTLSFTRYDTFLLNNCAIDVEKIFKFLDSLQHEPERMLDAALELRHLIIEVNPLLDPELLVINNENIIRVAEQSDTLENVRRLVDNPEWDKPEFDGPSAEDIENFVKAMPPPVLPFGRNSTVSPDQMVPHLWDETELLLVMIEYDVNDIPEIFKDHTSFEDEEVYKQFVVTRCVHDFQNLFILLDRMGYTKKFGVEKLTDMLYDISIQHNTFLAWEDIDLEKVKRAVKRKYGNRTPQRNKFKKKAPGDPEEDVFGEFSDIPEEDIMSLGSRVKDWVIGQDEVVEAVRETIELARCGLKEPDTPIGTFMFTGETGVGKCHGKGTELLMYDGSVKKVEEVVEGDLLMGDDSTPRTVLGLARGRDKMYLIIPTKGNPFVCNEAHILSLVHTATDDIINISIKDYLKQHKTFKHLHKLYRVPVSYGTTEVSIDPYFMGLWLGDGGTNRTSITTMDEEIVSFVYEYAAKLDLSVNINVHENNKSNTYTISSGLKGGHSDRNCLLNSFRRYDLILGEDKFIPKDYLINNDYVRHEVLAGLIDSDGHLINNMYELSTKHQHLAYQIEHLSLSLGYYCSVHEKIVEGKTYYRLFVSGDVHNIPVKLERKKANKRKQIKNVSRTSFSVEPIGIGDYYGFTLDGNHLYLLHDCIVTHNTYSARMFAQELCGDEHAIVRIDCSEYSQKHEVSKLIGAPSGYVGYEEGGYLTNALMKRPFTVVLFDEIEKAHQSLHNILLQVMDEGRLTSNKGETVSFGETLLVLTSNVGVKEVESIGSRIGLGDVSVMTKDKQEKAIQEALKGTFKPEFLNRLDGIVTFNSLTKEHGERIIDIAFRRLNEWLKDKDIHVDYTSDATAHIYDVGFRPGFGARPLKRAMRKEVMLPISKLMLKDKIKKSHTIKVDFKDGKLTFSATKKKAALKPVAAPPPIPADAKPVTNGDK